ncbi:hypothetical protein FVR03_06135 [Pontibacter qinzhouensis]|uniref:Uncharacterized protein n=2 Tax=Pontibacter qinzhouensis TaxID=2603253 RepID=A0A5C8KCR9_9BACT|nr:hypothetical protein FVR03_06135 [Pontibacter qinzhouensis]
MGACTNSEGIPEESDSDLLDAIEADAASADTAGEGELALPKKEYDGQLLAQVVFDSVDYIVSPEQLLQPFIQEFGDGTVVDKVMIRKVQEDKGSKPAYYVVGIGLLNGAFRSMALPLDVASDNSLYLSTQATKYICNGNTSCGFCFFTFKGNEIVGCSCDTNQQADPNQCKQQVTEGNMLLKRGVKLRRYRDLTEG